MHNTKLSHFNSVIEKEIITMSEQQTFRTAFNGFNRDDVVQYIEQINSRHAAELSQLNSDMQYLQEKLTQYEAYEDGEDASPELEERVEEQAGALVEQSDRIAELERQLAEALDATQTAEALLEEAEAQNTELKAQLAAALARNTEVQSKQDAELAAYRRAERVERQANERAQQIHNQVNGALADASAKVDSAAAQIAVMTEDAMRQIRQLQLAVASSKQVLEDTASSLYAIRPIEIEE
ncbi:MAG: hypothetical protein IJZ38_12935 [Bacteroides sp.]|nr:hypothetical protein [Bacteroides sp.]